MRDAKMPYVSVAKVLQNTTSGSSYLQAFTEILKKNEGQDKLESTNEHNAK